MTSEQVWKPVVGFEGLYSVSDSGRVRSERREVNFGPVTRMVGGIVLKPKVDRYGYPAVTLYKANVSFDRTVHTLVLAAHVGPCPKGYEACHNDGNRMNCSKGNLRWDTRKNNHADKLQHGTAQRGEANPRAKLSKAQVLAIRADTRGPSDVAKDYDITPTHACAIQRRKTWVHL